MLLNNDYLQIMTLITTYMFIYNVTSFLLFSTLLQFVNSNLKTLFSFSTLGVSNIFTKILIVAILSLAGVPPLVGFFSKIFVFIVVANSSLTVLFPALFVLLFTGLYFYIQNIRFLHSTNSPNLLFQSELQTRLNPMYFLIMFPIVTFIIFGFFFIEDVLLLTT